VPTLAWRGITKQAEGLPLALGAVSPRGARGGLHGSAWPALGRGSWKRVAESEQQQSWGHRSLTSSSCYSTLKKG